jgi:hypothetical protein
VRTRTLTVSLTFVAALCAGCGGGTSAPATGATPSPTPQAVRNLERGEVAAIKGDVVTLTARDGTDTSFELTPTTQVRQQQTADISEVSVGTCAFGLGQRVQPDLVEATAVIIGDHGAGGAGDCRRGSGGDIGRAGVAGGEVTAVAGDTYSVNSNAGPLRFKVNLQTKVIRLVMVPTSTLVPGQCVTASGPRNSAGVVAARNVVISPASVSGCFAPGSLGGG